MHKTIYRSSISPAIVLFLIAVFVFSGKPIVQEGFSWSAIIFLLLPIAFVVYVFASIKYTIVDDHLEVSDGILIRTAIPIQNIKRIKKTHSVLSAPAASLDRIEITYNDNDYVIISPKHRIQFLQHLTSINPNIDIDSRLKTKG
ncbi:MAG TPA: PH domain-containing protein [Flavobacteriaceae bacterium]|nr:PH domain-containing protein [Flavobacteriaceae bacterium]